MTHRKLHPFYRGRYKIFDEIRPRNTSPGESNIPPVMLRFPRVTIDKSERFESPASCNTQWMKFHKFYYTWPSNPLENNYVKKQAIESPKNLFSAWFFTQGCLQFFTSVNRHYVMNCYVINRNCSQRRGG